MLCNRDLRSTPEQQHLSPSFLLVKTGMHTHSAPGDGTNPTPGGADYFYQIVERYSPHVIAGVFFGHTHEDQAFIYYSNNGTIQSAENAIANAWVGPSLTPLTNLNSG